MSRDGYTETFVKQSRNNNTSKHKAGGFQHRGYGYDHDPTTGKETTYKRRDKYTSRYNVEENEDDDLEYNE